MGAVHALIAKVFRKFIHPIKAAHNESFEVEFIGNAQIQRNVQRIVVGDKRTGRGPSRNGLQNGCFHLEIAFLVEKCAYGLSDFGAFNEGVFDLRIDDQIDIALAVAQFGIIEFVVDLALGIGFG